MATNALEEIRSYLEHRDYVLLMRRLLDYSLDTNEAALIREAIDLSKAFRAAGMFDGNPYLAPDLETGANQLLAKLVEKEAAKPMHLGVLVQANAVSKTYNRGNFSLKPLSLDIHCGQIIGVVGENGNGKTTLLRCLAGQLALDQGVIHYTLLKDPDHYTIKNHVVFVPQRIPRWFGQLKDNLHFSAALVGIHGEWNDLLVEFMLERFGLTQYAHLSWNQISSGYRTRFEIARILLKRPKVLILDEPLANLDINAQQTLLTDLKFLTKSSYNPMGVILTSQQLHEVEKIADNVLLIRDGNCVYRTGDQIQQQLGFAFEIEIGEEREAIIYALQGFQYQLTYNGGNYTITSPVHPVPDMLRALVNSGIYVRYYRDITTSTKRLF
jgi:ABC-2 type transport system ATP-binding protein